MSETFELQANGTYQILKDPDAVLDYTFDFTDWLDLVSDTINTAVCSIVDAPTTGGAVNSSAIVGKKVVAWVSGGTPGKKIALRCRITTNNSPARVDDRTVYLKVKER
jgi:hypothetical protein